MTPYLDSNTDRLTVGDSYSVQRAVINILDGDSIAEAWLVIKTDLFDQDSQAVMVKHITTVEMSDGVVEVPVDSSGTSGFIRFELQADETAVLDPFNRYSYVIVIKSALGVSISRESGFVVPRADVYPTH